MNSIILFSNAFLYVFFSFCNFAAANDAHGHIGEHNVSTIKVSIKKLTLKQKN